MKSRAVQLFSKLNEQLNFADLEIDDPIQRSESNINDAWGINFNNGLQGIINKKAIGKVRAIRAF